MAESWNKKEREKKKQKERKDKADKMKERKENGSKKNLGDMMAYVDENGNISSTPPDPKKRKEIKADDIEIGVVNNRESDDVMRTGRVSFFNQGKGFGFIKDSVSQESIFFHVNGLSFSIKENDRVNFRIEMGPRGPSAANIELVK